MGDLRAASLDNRAVQPLVRPDPVAALRPTDPVKERFEVGVDDAADDKAKAAGAEETSSFLVDADGRSRSSAAAIRGRAGGQGSGLLGAFTNFLAKIFTQADDPSTTAGIRLAGNGAYTRAVAANAAPPAASGGGSLIQSSGLPQLASGRMLDLSI